MVFPNIINSQQIQKFFNRFLFKINPKNITLFITISIKITVNVPLNIKITFKDIIDEPKVIKLFRYSSRNEPEKNSANFNKSTQEFTDLNVTWE